MSIGYALEKHNVDIKDPCRLLAIAVIYQAVEDMKDPLFIKYPYEKPYWKENARRFLSGDWGHGKILEGWCEWADLDPGYVKRKVA